MPRPPRSRGALTYDKPPLSLDDLVIRLAGPRPDASHGEPLDGRLTVSAADPFAKHELTGSHERRRVDGMTA